MARVIETTVYSFNELSDDAKQAAIEYFRNDSDLWGWQSEYWDSAQAFAKIAPIDITEADYDRAQVTIRWTDTEEVKNLSGLRAWKWLQNNGWFDLAKRNKQGDCTLTGFCGDCDLFDDIEKYSLFPQSVPELGQLFYECAQSWVYAAQQDCQHAYSDAGITETIQCNDYEFTADGKLI